MVCLGNFSRVYLKISLGFFKNIFPFRISSRIRAVIPSGIHPGMNYGMSPANPLQILLKDSEDSLKYSSFSLGIPSVLSSEIASFVFQGIASEKSFIDSVRNSSLTPLSSIPSRITPRIS